MTGLLKDIRYALRTLFKSKVFTITALLLLAVGTGVNTLIFSVVDSVLLRPLPFSKSQQLYLLWESSPLVNYARDLAVTPADFLEIRGSNRVFRDTAALRSADFNLTSTDQPERVAGARVSANLFNILGIQPFIGRGFTPEEELAGNDSVVTISYALWQRRFGGSTNVIGKTLRLDDKPYTIVGVMPFGFEFPRGAEMPAVMRFGVATEIWKPIGLTSAEYSDRGNFRYAVLGRVKNGISFPQITADIGSIIHAINARQKRAQDVVVAKVIPLQESMVRNVRPALVLLWLASFFVLALAAFNVANLLLARSFAHQREIAVRAALGASRWRLVRQLMIENLVLTVSGGLLGFALACWLLRFLTAAGPADLPRLESVSIDINIFLVSLLISIVTGLTFGLIPARAGITRDLERTLRSGAATHSRFGDRLQKTLMAFQVSISLVLVTCALLTGISFAKLMRVDLGFTADNILTMEIPLTPTLYANAIQRKDFFESVIEKVRQLPGITGVAVIDSLPLSGGGRSTNTTFHGQPCNAGDELMVEYRFISPDYFHVMGVPLNHGRTFNPQDSSDTSAIINETFAQQCWPGQDPLGKQFKSGRGDKGPWLSVIGMVKDVHNSSPGSGVRPQAYLPYFDSGLANLTLVSKTAGDPQAMVKAEQEAIWSVDKRQPVSKIQTMRQLFSESLARQRFESFLFVSFAILGIGLACAGVYGVTSYTVAQRNFEIGIRMAFGASRGHLLGLILKDALRIVFLGVGIGIIASIEIAQLLQSELFEISGHSPLLLSGIAILMITLAGLASFFPARRLSSGDPIRGLRQE